MTAPLVLASTSPYKKMLLERLKIPFNCVSPNTDEQPKIYEKPEALALRLAQEKAMAAADTNPNAIIIGSDQVGELNGKILGKPGNFEQAFRQLSAQSGETVYFHSAVSVVKILENGNVTDKTTVNTTTVVFKQLTSLQIENYLKQDKPYNCAGSFKSEGLGISLFSSINTNDPSSLVGLPLIDLCRLLAMHGVNIPNA
ncbi:MAG: Maf family nucleotide pyrophosphatase [Porticoccaceae bacterium]|nr:Maf family nucleotide pyrophosphatase [Porticoccaceae bacterium]